MPLSLLFGLGNNVFSTPLTNNLLLIFSISLLSSPINKSLSLLATIERFDFLYRTYFLSIRKQPNSTRSQKPFKYFEHVYITISVEIDIDMS